MLPLRDTWLSTLLDRAASQQLGSQLDRDEFPLEFPLLLRHRHFLAWMPRLDPRGGNEPLPSPEWPAPGQHWQEHGGHMREELPSAPAGLGSFFIIMLFCPYL